MIKLNFKKIHKQLPLILLLPAILGGLWQIFELSKMSISFIRFFSPTQLLPDGLMILLMITILYLSFKLGTLMTNGNIRRKSIVIYKNKPSGYNPYSIKKTSISKLKYIENPIYRLSIIPIHLIIIFGGISIYYIFYLEDIYSEIKNDFNFIIFAIFFMFFISIAKKIFESFVVLIVLFSESKLFIKIQKYFFKHPLFNELIQIPFKIFIIVIFFTIVFSPLFMFNLFHQKYLLPHNLKNLNYIQNALTDKNFQSNKISYFNDKYIFIEHITDDKNITIEILKFEKLFQ